jgi:hypothetical protein
VSINTVTQGRGGRGIKREYQGDTVRVLGFGEQKSMLRTRIRDPVPF